MALKQRVLALTVSVAIGFAQRYSEVQAAVPFTPAGDGHDTVSAFVNGKGPFAFILDTGADGSALYQWFAEKQHLSKGRFVTWADRQESCLLRPTS
jgi:predicted aspartyl protease